MPNSKSRAAHIGSSLLNLGIIVPVHAFLCKNLMNICPSSCIRSQKVLLFNFERMRTFIPYSVFSFRHLVPMAHFLFFTEQFLRNNCSLLSLVLFCSSFFSIDYMTICSHVNFTLPTKFHFTHSRNSFPKVLKTLLIQEDAFFSPGAGFGRCWSLTLGSLRLCQTVVFFAP